MKDVYKFSPAITTIGLLCLMLVASLLYSGGQAPAAAQAPPAAQRPPLYL
jgi:hypothetical protein